MFLKRLSIKHIFLLVVTIIALPAVCIIVNTGIEQRKNAVQNAKKETQKLCDSIISEQKSLISSTHQLFIALSQLPEVKERNPLELNIILNNILGLSPQYSNIYITDADGVVWAAGDQKNVHRSVAEKRFFKNALSSGRFSSGEYNLENHSKTPSLDIGYPIKDKDGAITAVLCANLSLSYYRKMFESYRLPKGASVALLDHDGVILGRAVEPEKYVGTQSNREILDYMLRGPEAETSIGKSSIIGDSRIQTYQKLILNGEDKPYMYVRAGIPTHVVMANSNALLAKNLLIYSFALVFGFFISWLIGKKFIVNRILILQRSSQRLADGDLSTRVAHEIGGGEIGHLGEAFDEMAARLASRQESLRISEENYRDIFHTTHDALMINDSAGRIYEVNQAAVAMFGYSSEEFRTISVEDLSAGESPYSLQEAHLLLERSLQEGSQKFEWLSKRRDGETFWSEVTITPTSDLVNRRILAVIRDITERKEIEKMREALLSSISHEMRTPITAMLGFLEYVIDNKVEESELKEYHKIMHKEGERLNEMVTNFLDMQRLKAKFKEYNFNSVNTVSLINGVVALFAGPSAKHVIKTELPKNLPLLFGEGELLHQALVNILSNAIKYSQEGSEILVTARAEDERVILSVTDHGEGISPESLEKIFDPFYRDQNVFKKHIPGTGLGLALVKEIINAHQGEVWVESVAGAGSSFYLSLPLHKASQNSQDSPK